MKLRSNSLIPAILLLLSLLVTTGTARANTWQKCAARPSSCPYFFDVYPRDKSFRNAFHEALQQADIRKPSWIGRATATPAEVLTGPNGDRFLFFVCEPHNCGGYFFYLIYDPNRAGLRGLRVIDDRQAIIGNLSEEEKEIILSKMR